MKTKILLSLGVIVGTVLLLNNADPEAHTIHHDLNIDISSHSLTSQSLLVAPYKEMDIFLSPEEDSGFDFTSVGGYWEQNMPNGTNVELEFRFKVEDKWTDWVEVEEEEEGDKYFAMAATNPATSMQYRFLMYGDGVNSPSIKDIDITFINAKKAEIAPRPEPFFLAFTQSNIISRSSWGASESYRFLSKNMTDPVLIEIDPDLKKQFADELEYKRVVEEDSSGKVYKWPLQYPNQVKKIIIHHTATSKNLEDPEQAIRDIYYYHSVTRGWGDIGYNYIIDKRGKVYEGRFGGEGVIGAHAGLGNTGSIGIAVLGNYEEDEAPEVVVEALGKLIADKSRIHGIDPEGESSFRGQIMPNVFGHKDLSPTACPGDYLYEKLPIIRTIAANSSVSYDGFDDNSRLYYLEMKPGDEETLTFKLKNTSGSTWKSAQLIVDQNRSLDGVLSFPGKDGFVSVSMGQSEVANGKTATFSLKIKAGNRGDIVDLRVSPVINGEFNPTPIVVPINVEQSNFKYKLVNTFFPPLAMEKGETFTGHVKLMNRGNVTWTSASLGTDHDRDRPSVFNTTTPTRLGALVDGPVKPGETGTFEFAITAPSEPGYYKEYFTPVIDGVTWMADTGMYFETTVYGDKYDAEFISLSAAREWKVGRSQLVMVKLRNLGQVTWDDQNMVIDVLRELDLKVTRAELLNDSVKPGEVATITFIAQVSLEETEGKKNMIIRPKVDGVQLLRGNMKVHYYVVEAKPMINLAPDYVPAEKGDNIRIKLKSITGDIYVNGIKITAPETFTGTTVNVNDRRFRGKIEIIEEDGKLVAINELPLEDYLRGLAEEPNDEPYEKIKAIIVAARSYALHYMTDAEKFPGRPYHLDDDPATSQLYKGYDYETKAPNVVKAVNETIGQVVTYDGKLVKTPYFSRSDGTFTKSAMDVWGWDAPFLVPVSDSYCDGTAFWGHGVGLSGCGSRGMAEAGFKYDEILSHYYSGTKVTDLY